MPRPLMFLEQLARALNLPAIERTRCPESVARSQFAPRGGVVHRERQVVGQKAAPPHSARMSVPAGAAPSFRVLRQLGQAGDVDRDLAGLIYPSDTLACIASVSVAHMGERPAVGIADKRKCVIPCGAVAFPNRRNALSRAACFGRWR
jgi:hypothetical protein